MLVIRMQRTGRKGHAQFRVVVQDSRRTPTSGRIVAALGNYNPHTKEASVDKEKASFYLEHGAQPSDRVARLLKAQGVKLPDWVVLEGKKQGSVKNAEKRRSTRPAEPVVEKPAEAPAEEVTNVAAEVVDEETPSEETPDTAEPTETTEDKPTE